MVTEDLNLDGEHTRQYRDHKIGYLKHNFINHCLLINFKKLLSHKALLRVDPNVLVVKVFHCYVICLLVFICLFFIQFHSTFVVLASLLNAGDLHYLWVICYLQIHTNFIY